MAKQTQFNYDFNKVSIDSAANMKAQRQIDNIESKESQKMFITDLFQPAVNLANTIATSQNKTDAIKSFALTHQGKGDATHYSTTLSGLSANERLDTYTEKVNSLLQESKGEVTAYNKGYITQLESYITTSVNEAEQETNMAAFHVIVSNTETYMDEIFTTANPDSIVDRIHTDIFPNVPKSSVRDGMYTGVGGYLANLYSQVQTMEDLAGIDEDKVKLNAKFSTNNFRASNAKGTKQMVKNIDSAIKTARDTAILRIQQPFKEKKAVLNISTDSATNIEVDKYTGDILVLPTFHKTDNEYADVSTQSGAKAEVTITDTANYSKARISNIKAREEIEELKGFSVPYKDLPIERITKKLLDTAYKIQVTNALGINDTATAATLLTSVQQPISYGPTLKSFIYSDDLEQQTLGLVYYNKIIPMVFTPEEVSEFTALSSLTTAGYTVEQSKEAIENYKATPPKDRRTPTKDVQETLANAGEGMTSKQYSYLKEMVGVMSNSGVSESVIEDYISAVEDTFITRIGTTLTFGGMTVLHEGGIVPSVTEDLLLKSYQKVLDKVIEDNKGLESDDLTIVYLNGTNEVKVVLKKDTSIVLSKGTTNLTTLTKAIKVEEEKAKVKPKPKTYNPNAGKELIEETGNAIRDVAKDTVETTQSVIDTFSGPITKGVERTLDFLKPSTKKNPNMGQSRNKRRGSK